jgi:hypothetical protein
MWLHYGQHGHFSNDKISDMEDQQHCHAGEHTKVYAYNLCDCLDCPKRPPVPEPACTADKACGAYSQYDYRQHDIKTSCSSAPAPPPMELPPTNCPTPEHSKTCHFWGDPHFTHLFFSQNNKGEKKKGGYHGGRNVDFWPSGAFNLASNADQSFDAQVFFCPWRSAPGLGTGLAMRFGDDLIHMVRGANSAPRTNQVAEVDLTEFYINGKKISWDELGNATGTRGKDVPGTGGLTTAFMYMQQFKTDHQSNMNILPVCAGNGQDSLVELTARKGSNWYVQEVTIRSNQPGRFGICGAEDKELTKGAKQEAMRVDAKKNLFTTKQMKSMCDMCGLSMDHGACGAPGHEIPPEVVCKSAKADLDAAKAECAKAGFVEGTNWFDVCVMETCVSGEGAAAIAKIEEHMQEVMIQEEEVAEK